MNKLLKLLLALPLVLLCCTLTACGDDNDNNGIRTGKELVGKWVGSDFFNHGETDNWQFKSNGQFDVQHSEESGMNGNAHGSYQVDGSTLRLNWGVNTGESDSYCIGTYNVSGDVLSYSYTWYSSLGENAGYLTLKKQ